MNNTIREQVSTAAELDVEASLPRLYAALADMMPQEDRPQLFRLYNALAAMLPKSVRCQVSSVRLGSKESSRKCQTKQKPTLF